MTEHPIVEPHIKRRIYDRQSGLCAYCGHHRNIKYMTVDHIIPLSKGGKDEEWNLQCVCKKCNGLKSNMLPGEFTIFLYRMLKRSLEIEARSSNAGEFPRGYLAGKEDLKEKIFSHFQESWVGSYE